MFYLNLEGSLKISLRFYTFKQKKISLFRYRILKIYKINPIVYTLRNIGLVSKWIVKKISATYLYFIFLRNTSNFAYSSKLQHN